MATSRSPTGRQLHHTSAFKVSNSLSRAAKSYLGRLKGLVGEPLKEDTAQATAFAVHAKQKAADAAVRKTRSAAGTLQNAHAQLRSSGVDWRKFAGISLATSVTFGTFIQVSHNNGLLPVYDVWAFKVGPALQSGLIPIVLAPIWVAYTYLTVLLDEANAEELPTQLAVQHARSLAYVLLCWGSVVAAFLLSDFLYLTGTPHYVTSLLLALTCAANWKAFDGTKQGILLGAALAVGAPLAEAFIVNILHLWHYDRPDFLGVPHWSAWCYGQYAWGVGNFGRWLYDRMRKDKAV